MEGFSLANPYILTFVTSNGLAKQIEIQPVMKAAVIFFIRGA
jgi:hypothetical protein